MSNLFILNHESSSKSMVTATMSTSVTTAEASMATEATMATTKHSTVVAAIMTASMGVKVHWLMMGIYEMSLLHHVGFHEVNRRSEVTWCLHVTLGRIVAWCLHMCAWRGHVLLMLLLVTVWGREV
jgi:hypothetical protein